MEHEKLVSLEEEHAKTKWKLIAIRNGKEPISHNENQDKAEAIEASKEAYARAQK